MLISRPERKELSGMVRTSILSTEKHRLRIMVSFTWSSVSPDGLETAYIRILVKTAYFHLR